jgi:GNAT superfamily N-acetyltransferase
VRAQCPARPRLPTSQPSHITKTRRRAWRSFLGEHRPAGRPSSRRGEQAGEAALGPHVGPSPCSAGLATGGGCFLRGRRGLLWVKGALAAHRDYRGQGGRDLRRSYLAWATGRSGGKGGLLILVLYLAYLAYLVAYLARNHLAWATGRVGRGRPGRSCLVLRTYSWRRSPLGSSRCTSLALS